MHILEKFGDLFQDDSIRVLVGHGCEFVEKNPIPWVDVNEERIIFDRKQVFRCCKGSAEPLVAVFEAIAPLHVSAHKARGTFLFRRVYLFGYITAVGNVT